MRWKQFLTPTGAMDAGEAREFMENNPEGSYTLLDVRQPREYEKARIPGALLIPLAQLPDRASEIPKDKPVVVY